MALFKTQSLLTISLDTTMSLGSASTKQIKYRKPDDTTGAWNATVNGTSLEYEVKPGDIDQAGDWEFQTYIVIDSRTAPGETFKQHFDNPIG